ncbi:MAG TPA: hypothetical protein VM598_01695 [Bdellovibrionota bacterium]|nr:hypothetical protein [Bdellovibrionota bacterium]
MRLSVLLLLAASFLSGCQVYNSGARNRLAYGGQVDLTTDFGRAFTVIRERCLNCHAHFGGWTTDADWVNNGYVVPGEPAESQVYNRLAGAHLGIAPEDMPLDSALTSDELAAIREWIDDL